MKISHADNEPILLEMVQNQGAPVPKIQNHIHRFAG